MKAGKLASLLLAAGLGVSMLAGQGMAVAQNDSGAKQDMKNAGHESTAATKDAGRGVKQGTKKAYHKTKRGTKKTAHKAHRAVDPN